MTLGVFYPLGGHTANRDGYQLSPLLVQRPEAYANREAYFTRIQRAIDDGAASVLIHRMYGEPTTGDAMDIDSRSKLQNATDPRVRDYEQHMTMLLIRLALANPTVRFDIYLGSFRCVTMQTLIDLGLVDEWRERFRCQLEPIMMILDSGGNARIVFDEAATYQEHEPYTDIVSQLARRYPGRVVVEAIPLEDSPLLGLPAIAREGRYGVTRANHPYSIQHTPHITRWMDGRDLQDPVEVLRDCVRMGHDFYATEAVFANNNLTVRDLAAVVNAGEPQGTGE